MPIRPVPLSAIPCTRRAIATPYTRSQTQATGRRASLLMAAAAVLLSGCSALSGSQQSDEQALLDERNAIGQWQVDTADSADNAAASETTDTTNTSLLDLLGSDQLEQLVEASLSANPGLQQSWFTLRQLQAQRLGTRASQLPSADVSFQGSRSENNGNSFTSSLNVSWELDLWAKLADSTSAAELDVAEQLAVWQQTRDTLVAEVMQGWLNLINLNNSIRLQQLRLDALRKNEQAIVQRYKAGIGSLDDLDSARTSLASGEATLANNHYQLKEAWRALRTLLGTADNQQLAALGLGNPEAMPENYPQVQMPLVDLPEQTLARRPDLKAAWNAYQASSKRVDIAYKDMLPSISLSASLSDSGSTPGSSLFTDPVWSLVGQLTQPLFQGGQLKAAANAAEFSAAASAQSYRDTLLTAVSEVENALDNEKALAMREDAIERALGTAKSNEARYLRRYRSGLATLLELISVQQSRYDLEDNLNSLRYERLSNRIALGLALGLPGITNESMTPSATPSETR